MMSWREELLERKRQAMKLMDADMHWREANEQSGLNYSKSGIQHLYREWRERGDEALIDQRHGHAYKATAEVREMLNERCEEDPDVRASQVVNEIEAEFGVKLNPNYVTMLRHQLGLPVPGPGNPAQRGLFQSEREAEEAPQHSFAPQAPAPEKEPEQDFSP
jgi:transposase